MSPLPENIEQTIENAEVFDLKLYIPAFASFPEDVVLLHFAPKKEWPEIAEMTFTDPRVMDIYFEGYAGAFPLLEFGSFVKGVATAALIIRAGERPNVKVALERLVQTMIEIGGDMPSRPALPAHLEELCLEAVSAVINFTEVFNWRRMLSFIYGIYWLAGFLVAEKPTKLQRAGLERLAEVATTRAKLGVLPT